jgi:hypothetical protein
MTTRPAEQRVMTASATTVLRRSVFWICATVFALLVALIGLAFAGSLSSEASLSATNPGPGGSKALVEVLRQQGVDVEATSTLERTADAVDDDPASTTLLYFDPDGILDDAQRAEVYGLADHVVVIDPSFEQLIDLSPDIAQAGAVEGELDADCTIDAATNAGSITGDGFGYRYTGTAAAQLCFGSGDDVYSVVGIERDGGTATVVGATAALANGTIADHGNAAFALTLLGRHPQLVWYLPTAADLSTEAPPTLGELSPEWVLPAVALVALTALAGAVWRGRRFGPLIVENLPVTVRANETMQGRARLYEKSSARLRAIDALRIGAVERIARSCGLPRVATVDDVIAAASAVTGSSELEVRRVLVDARPQNDRDLVRLSDELLVLERAVQAAVIPT